MHVFCVGMYRSCSTWQYQVARTLVERHLGGRGLGFRTGDEYAAVVQSRALPADAWVVLKPHDKDRRLARALAHRGALGLYAHRDLRDAVDSLAHKLALPVDIVIRQGMVHRMLVNDRYWATRPGVLVQRYRSIMAEPVAAVTQIAEHLGLVIPPIEAQEIAAQYSLEANRRRAAEIARSMQAQGLNPADPAHATHCDPDSLLHWNHIRTGADGRWRTALTPHQLALLDLIAGAWLIARGYEPDRSWVPHSAGARCAEARTLRRELAQAWAHSVLYGASLRAPRAVALLRRLLSRSRALAAAPITATRFL